MVVAQALFELIITSTSIPNRYIKYTIQAVIYPPKTPAGTHMYTRACECAAAIGHGCTRLRPYIHDLGVSDQVGAESYTESRLHCQGWIGREAGFFFTLRHIFKLK